MDGIESEISEALDIELDGECDAVDAPIPDAEYADAAV